MFEDFTYLHKVQVEVIIWQRNESVNIKILPDTLQSFRVERGFNRSLDWHISIFFLFYGKKFVVNFEF